MIALLTNDDGIDARGLAALRKVAEAIFDEVWIVAPASQMSQIGHRVTTDEPIRYEERAPRTFAVHSTPADCTRVALNHILPEKPDWILSGINHGGNLGRHDFAISGTIAAVREGAFAGIPGVAASHFMKRGQTVDWDLAGDWFRRGFEAVVSRPLDEGEFWCINLPHPAPGDPRPELVDCEQERGALLVGYEERKPGELSYVGDYHDRPRAEGSDVDICFSGHIAISRAAL